MDKALWRAIINCDTTFDGEYYYAVKTTGIFCRPSCRSRTPRPENVLIFNSVNEAKAAGFRPCKRCRPDESPLGPDATLVEHAKSIIELRYHEPLTLNTLAQNLKISPYHLHRVFKRLTGFTLAECIFQRRIHAAEEALRTEPFRTVTEIALAVGFRSLSHFSTVFRKTLMQSPSDYRTLHMTGQEPAKEAKQ
ncbi:bifunctional transcriptional activator/DNA repair enzyme AdaA [Fodinisporobacter ferrooxydans]|uniref:Bifunctional transcriptional activator/DNA repair enzyme AdaA n=1 Tax=Fodinisporobacter ferrooxydans TaxID=2901836 RepID=A0ABY4CLK1_9BACL|nr:bifunctional transcriptional activator/DNA repair enzyme AdaA [Alicyclobacillaceae bacterium MYW30-H2]